jgi:hypothetical protein
MQEYAVRSSAKAVAVPDEVYPPPPNKNQPFFSLYTALPCVIRI